MAIFCENVIFNELKVYNKDLLYRIECKASCEKYHIIYNIGPDLLWLTHCGLVTPYGDIGLHVNIGSGNGLLPDCTKLLLYLKYTPGWFQACQCAQSMIERRCYNVTPSLIGLVQT